MTYKRKKYHFGDTHLKKKWRTKRRTKDLDQVNADLEPKKTEQLLEQKTDFDTPGLGQFYCVHCAKHFIDAQSFEGHVKSKPHKRRLHALKTEPYSVEESLRAAGMGSYVQPKKRKMETLIPMAIKEGILTVTDLKKKKVTEDIDGDEKMKG